MIGFMYFLETRSTFTPSFLLRNLLMLLTPTMSGVSEYVTRRSISLCDVCPLRAYEPKISVVSTLYFSLRTGLSSCSCRFVSSRVIKHCSPLAHQINNCNV